MVLGELSIDMKVGLYRAKLFSFPLCKDHSFVLSVAHCLKTAVFSYHYSEMASLGTNHSFKAIWYRLKKKKTTTMGIYFFHFSECSGSQSNITYPEYSFYAPFVIIKSSTTRLVS